MMRWEREKKLFSSGQFQSHEKCKSANGSGPFSAYNEGHRQR